jgi:hypothetical protein
MLLEALLVSNSPFEPWPLNEQTAKVLGLPLMALTATAQRVANSRNGYGLTLSRVSPFGRGQTRNTAFPPLRWSRRWTALSGGW